MYLISIVGPTAIGKTALAIQLAKHYNTHIISADSRQFYNEISIGTAKPSDDELKEAPHHFINNKSITETYSAGDFERDAIAKLEELFKEHSVLIMVGGSGLYVNAVLEGLHEMPSVDQETRDGIIELYKAEGIEALQNKLKTLDEDRFHSIDIMNPQRLMRAIEIALLSKEKFVELKQQQKKQRPFKIIKIGLNTDRQKLYDRINQRVDLMLSAGLLKECQSVYEFRNHYALQTVGYTEIFDFFDGKCELDQSIELIKQHTRNYAKRQLTWFRRDADTAWFEPDNDKEILAHIKSLMKE
jgi:tRNA dimethylallyltransferase